MNGKVTYRQQYTRCGKQRCKKCREGAGHGPYWYAYWSENGRTISKYVGIHPPEEVLLAIQAREAEVLEARTGEEPEADGRDLSLVAESAGGLDRAERERAAEAGPLVRVHLLGHFRVERRAGEQWEMVANRTWQRRRARALLGCLLSQPGRRMGREQVMEALWPDLDVETAANRLNGAVHELRQILEPGIERPAASKLLRLERDILMLADTSAIWVDADVFEQLLYRINQSNDAEKIQMMLEEAWVLYEGDYLLEELYSEWAAARRESLRRGWMGLLLHLAQVRSERGALTSAIEPLDRLLAADPTNETAVRRLMVLLTQLDRRGEAIRAYKRLATILQREYESDPLPETIELYQALRQGQFQVLAPLPEIAGKPTQMLQHTRNGLEKSPTGPLLPLTDLSEKNALFAPVASDQPLSPSSPTHAKSSTGRQQRHPLVGREPELEAIQALLTAIHQLAPRVERKKEPEATPRPRLAHCAIILGETGIGKTRLAEELSQRAHALGWRVSWTRGYEQEGTIPYRPWIEILRALLQSLPMDQLIRMMEDSLGQTAGETPGALNPAATVQARLDRLAPLLPELALPPETQAGRSQNPVGPEQERFLLWEAVLSLLNALAQSGPLLLVLDDLHWTDDSSLELLAYLARHQQNERIMMIGTCRETELIPGSLLRSLIHDLRREQVLMAFPLQPLSQAQIARLLVGLPVDLVKRIQNQAGGNPLFAEELGRLSETPPSNPPTRYGKHFTSQLDETPVAYSDEADPLPLPDTIAAVLEKRLARLGTACQNLLSRAAVLGRSFEFGLLMSMTGEAGSNEDGTLDLLEEALRSGLLTEESSGGRIAYHFWHPLIVSHLYERLSAARRAQLHRRAAQALIELSPHNDPKMAAAIAYHLSRYGQDKASLAHYAEIAANQAMLLSAYPEAMQSYRLTLEALQELHASAAPSQLESLHLADLLENMAECNYMLGNASESRLQYTQALEIHKAQQREAADFATPAAYMAWRQDEAQVQAMLWRSIGRVWKYLGEFEHAHECARQGKAVLREVGLTSGVAWACLEHLDGSTCWMEGNFTEARDYVLEALRINEDLRGSQSEQARSGQMGLAASRETSTALIAHSRRVLMGDPLELGRMHETRGLIAASLAQYAESLQCLHTALEIFEKHGLIGTMSQVYSNIGAVHSMRSDYAVAITYFKQALELSERTGQHRAKFLVTANLGEVAARTGDLQGAASWVAESVELAERHSMREHISWSHATLGMVLQDLGEMREALEHFRQALAGARAIKSTMRVGLALVLLASWRVQQALVVSRQSAPSPFAGGLVARQNPECQRLLNAARKALERAFQLSGIDTETECTGQIVLTAISFLQGHLGRARLQASKAVADARQHELAHLIARAETLQGEIFAASGQDQEADAAFAQALHTCEEHKLRLEYARTLHRLGQSLLARSLQVRSGRGGHQASQANLTRSGLDYLRTARDIFAACQASLDLQQVEETLAGISPE